jgi:hypothetical protein
MGTSQAGGNGVKLRGPRILEQGRFPKQMNPLDEGLLSPSDDGEIKSHNFNKDGYWAAFQDDLPSDLQELLEYMARPRDQLEKFTKDLRPETFRLRLAKAITMNGFIQEIIPTIIPVLKKYWTSPADACPIGRQWNPDAHLRPLHPPSLALEPCQAFGFITSSFPYPGIRSRTKAGSQWELGELCSGVSWPYFTIECRYLFPRRDDPELPDANNLQNRHNGAAMIENLLRLKQIVGQEYGFLDSIQALSMDIDATTLSVSCHWATKSSQGQLFYRSAVIYRRQFNDAPVEDIHAIRAAVTNALEWIRDRTWRRVNADLTLLEERLAVERRVKGMTRQSSLV